MRELVQHVDRRSRMAESGRRQPIAARRAANAEIDPAWEEGVEYSELLGDLQGGVVGEHHPAASYSDPLCAAGYLTDQDFGTRASKRRGVVMLGDPVAGVSQAFGKLGKLDRFAQRLRWSAALSHRGLVDHGQSDIMSVCHACDAPPSGWDSGIV